MAKSLFLSFLFLAALVLNAQAQERKVHIVYMGDLPQEDVSVASTHHAMLLSAHGSASVAKKTLVFSYGRSFNGFAAKLTDEEARRISGMKGVLSVFPSRTLKLHTTRSWDFVGLSKDKVGGPLEGDVIIGLLDTGIWPESESFSDTNLGSPPSKWKGTCQGPNFNCSNKIIGARYYNSENFYDVTDFKSPRDAEGHGTHTSSTAAGGEVEGASYLGLAEGTARGGAPGARIAMYKVCWSFGCSSADILKAFDDAIADGVDIISVSLGSDFPTDYFEDPIAIGSFHAMKNGILTSNSAGNSGPFPVSVANFAPWTLTVAASTIDRKFVAKAVLGNGQVFQGLSINSFDLNGTTYPLIWGGDAVNYTVGSNTLISSFCFEGAMNSEIVEGSMVFCETIGDGSGILLANGVGTIMADSYYSDFAFNYPLPATVISTEDGIKVLDYIRTTEAPIATILVSDTPDDVMAPIVVSFSSRGPSPISPDILKPDITAPGVDILAAWSPVAPPSIYYADTRSVNYNIISGTSMSCPHAAGAAAHVKAVHPDWSPAAIKSALMTTATIMDPRKQEDLEFAYGSGQINPVAAVEPGLVFDASEADYVNFLCKQGYNTTTLQLLTGDTSVCNSTTPGRGWDLNYPSFSLYVVDGDWIQGVFTRTVTNVGAPNSTYMSIVIPPGGTIDTPSGINVTIEPSVLSFTEVGETKSFTVTVTGPQISQQPIMSGAIFWFDFDGNHTVRTPVVVYNYLPGAPYNLDTDAESSSMPGKKKTFSGSSLYKKKATFGHK
ncbi:Cucumisin [Heracleum sosnowskyi]|uniref:Cucumisin n=1 Tax=Heracleum sosnowskyi TaxID=360622 RepID=A0AAD8IJ76_9APIA|nr:Cucumisin [Heracleum sosnowskyi]